MLKTAPGPVDVQDLQFKLSCRLKVFDNAENKNFPQHCSLVAAASRFGLIFVGTNTCNIQAIQLKDIEKYTKSDGDKVDYPRRTLSLISPPTHLSVNCEHTVLAVVIENNNCPCALFYDVKSFWQQEIVKLCDVRLSPTPAVYVTEVGWNPALASIFTACKSDGTLGIYELKNPGIDINELPAAAGATCFCWSPKGKQIAVGSRDGKITQLKPDLKAVKVVNAPPLKDPHTLQSLQWISNYQFVGVFQPINPDNQAVFMVIDAPKTGEPTYINYDDICYSNGNTRPMQYYIILLPTWNILMAASSNSMEVGILGNSSDCWTQWIMGDAARAELPLSANHQDTLPVGCALDTGSTQPLPWGETTLPPAPMLLLFSHHGILCCFNVVNLKPGIPSVCSPPDSIKDVSGVQHFNTISDIQNKSNKDTPVKESNRIEVSAAIKVPVVESPKVTIGTSLSNPVSTLFPVQPQMTSAQGVNRSKAQPVNLFGGQATITPIMQPNKPTTQPVSQQYSTLFQSLSNSEVTKSIPTPVVPVAATTPTIPAVVSKPVVPSVVDLSSNVTKLSQPEAKDDLTKTEVTSVDLKAEEEAEKIFAQLVKEECIFLESELKAVLHQGKSLKLNLGSDEDMVQIVENTKLLHEFFQEVVESCVTQNAEVHILKQNLLQSWAWYEEARSRHLASEDESLMILLRAQPLDSASEKQLADIQHTNYYLESQISQAHSALDEQWENFQDYCKKTHRIQIPTMEMIFQTMVKQNAILKKQNYVLKDIASRIKKKSRSAVGSSLLRSVDDIKDLPEELKRLRMNPEDISQIQYQHVSNRMKNFSKEKVQHLRSFLKKREYSHISAIKPQLSSSVIQASPASKLKQHSLLSPKASPISKQLPPKKLDFLQSTPKPNTSISQPVTTSLPSSTPIEGLQNFALKFETKHFSNLPEKSFAPLKTTIASSPNSAFVSTAFGSNTPTPTVVPSTSKSTFLSASSETVTIPLMVKSTPSFGITTSSEADQPGITISTNNFSKPFSFSGSSSALFSAQGNVLNASKPPTNVFLGQTSKPLSSFGIETVLATTSVGREVKPITSTFNLSTKPVPVATTSLSLTSLSTSPVTAPAIAQAKTPTTLIFGSAITATPSTASLTFGSGAALSVFGLTNQKPSEQAVSTTSKPFSFANTTTTTASNLLSSLLSITTTATTSQSVTFSTAVTNTNSPKVTSASQSIFTPMTTNTLKNLTQAVSTVASSSSIFMSKQTTTTPSLLGVPNVATSVQRATSSTPTTSVPPFPGFSFNGAKSSVTAVVASGSPVVTTVAVTSSGVIATSSTPAIIPDVTTTASATSIFGAQLAIPKPSIFGSVSSTTSTTSSNISTATPTPKFTLSETQSNKPLALGGTETSKPSIFESVSITPATPSFGLSTTSSSSSIFGATPSTPATNLVASTASTTQSSIFAPGTATSTFGTPTCVPQPIFGGTPSSTANFGSPTPASTQSSIFGSAPSNFGSVATPVTQSQTSIFGSTPSTTSGFGSADTTTTQSSIFGAPPSTSNTSLFGAAPTAAAAKPIFGAAAPTSNQPPVFGSAVTSSGPPSIFGNPVTTTAQSQGFGLFGDTTQKSPIFGGTSTSTNQASIFGNSNQSTVFGNTPSTTSSVFGQNQASSTFRQPPFGSSGNSFGGSNAFGTSASTFGQSGGSIFGNAPITTSANIFGGSGTTTTGSVFPSSSSVFGTPTSSPQAPFGSGSIFSSTTQASSFSANPNTGGLFGFGSLSVGTPATTSSSAFGSSSAPNPFGGETKSVFGSSSTPSSTTPFGASSGSPFASPSQNFGAGFGNQSPFGQQSTFGQSSFGAFGQSPSGPFSSGSSGSVGQSGFGTNSNFQKPGGFGSSPVFGSSPAFGSAPSFGGTPSFGSPPSFGGNSKVFGGTNTGFNTAASSQSSGFGSLANQPTVGFGNLAQQAQNATSNSAFSGSSSFSSWR